MMKFSFFLLSLLFFNSTKSQTLKYKYNVINNGIEDTVSQCVLFYSKKSNFFYFEMSNRHFPKYKSYYGFYKYRKVADTIFIYAQAKEKAENTKNNPTYVLKQYLLKRGVSIECVDFLVSLNGGHPLQSAQSSYLGDTTFTLGLKKIECYVFNEIEKKSFQNDGRLKEKRIVYIRKDNLLPLQFVTFFNKGWTKYIMKLGSVSK